MCSFSLLHSPSIISGEFLDQQSQVDNSCSCRLNLMTQEEIVQRYYGLCYRYHCSRFGYHWSMEDTKTTCSSPKDIFNDSSCSWWPAIKYSLRKRKMSEWVWFHQVVFQTKCVISNQNIWKYPFSQWKLRRLWYVEETIFNSITQVTLCLNTAITLSPSIPNFYHGEFILCVTNCHEYNTKRFFVVKIKRRRIW